VGFVFIENPSDLNPYILIGAALIAFGVAWFVTPRLRDAAMRRGWFDMPEARRVHSRPTPRIGGLGICAGFTVAVLAGLLVGLFVPNFWRTEDIWRISLLLVGATLITAVMFVDDIRGLSPLVKLGWQFGVAAIVIVPQMLVSPDRPIGVLIESIAGFNLWPLAVPFTFVWIVGMINTVNTSDGLDGLAGGIVLIGALILFLETLFQNRDGNFQFTSSLLALALAAAIGGFLVFNWHPASIFMGDSGSNFLGYTLAVISIIDGAKVAIALLIIGFPVLDLAFVYLNRMYHGKPPHKADRSHFHHRLLDMGWSQPRIVSLFYAISVVFGIIGVLPFMQSWILKLIGLLALGGCLLPLLIYSVRRQPHSQPDETQPTPSQGISPRK
jgi:UDP-GlcNAc:undecaprenyl-phosphate/decaprenyl-phosphate GlcNAc-1-phosphate transferase